MTPEPGQERLVIRGPRWPGDIAVTAGIVTALGQVAPEPGDTELHCDGDLVTPGLVNAHHHLYQWMTRGRATSCDLFAWLSELYPVWGELSPDDVAAAATVGLAELALSGATTVADHHYIVPGGDDSVFDRIAGAARAVGVRLHLSRGSMDLGESGGGLPPDSVVESIDAVLASTERVAAAFAGDDLVTVVVAPCSPFSVTTDLMTASAELARRLGLRLHTHLAETEDEVEDCLARFGCRPLELVERLGWLSSDVWFAHGIHFDDDEIARIGAAGTGVAHCPRSNGRLGAGTAGSPTCVGPAPRSASAWTAPPPTRPGHCFLSCSKPSSSHVFAKGAPMPCRPRRRWRWRQPAVRAVSGGPTSAASRWALQPTLPSGRARISPISPTPSPDSC